MSAPTPAGVAALEEACREACALLEQLGQTFEGERRRPITRNVLKSCYGLVFTHSVKAGALLGFSRGHGIVIKKLQGEQLDPKPVPTSHNFGSPPHQCLQGPGGGSWRRWESSCKQLGVLHLPCRWPVLRAVLHYHDAGQGWCTGGV